jgi:GntR family transcriptional regulator
MHTVKHTPLAAFAIEDNGVPIYVQIRERFLQAIGTQALAPGEQMPTMRQVAVALKVDLNTVRHAYEELEQAGAITLVHGRGSFVAERPPQASAKSLSKQTERLARQTIAAATAAGLDPVALAQQILALLRKDGSS